MMIEIVEITYPGLGVASKAQVFSQSYEIEAADPVPCNTRLFTSEDEEIINIPSSVPRSDFELKTGHEIVDIVFQSIGIQRK